MTSEAPLSLARSEGRGSKASGSVAGGMMVSTCARWPTTARARLARSPVVATTRMVWADAADDTRNVAMMLTSAARGTNRARATSGLRRRSPAGNEHALGQQAVHALFVAGRGRRDATVHGNAGQSVGIEPGQLALLLQQVDHRHRRAVHGLVEVAILGDRDVILGVFRGRQLRSIARRLRIHAIGALDHIDYFRNPAVPLPNHDLVGFLLAHLAGLGEEFRRLRFQQVPADVELLVIADRDPVRGGLDARPLELRSFQHFDRDVELLVRGLDGGEIDFAVALAGVTVAGPQQRALDEDRDVEARSRHHLANVEIAGIAAGRDGRILPGLGAR